MDSLKVHIIQNIINLKDDSFCQKEKIHKTQKDPCGFCSMLLAG